MIKHFLVVAVSLGAVLLYLLATASGNSAEFSRNYQVLLVMNGVIALSLATLVGVQLWRLRAKLAARVFGSKLTLRLVLVFALMAVLPGALVYMVSVQFLTKSIDTWFDVSVVQALDRGFGLGQTAIDFLQDEVTRTAQNISENLKGVPGGEVQLQLTRQRELSGVQELTLYASSGAVLAYAGGLRASLVPESPPTRLLAEARTRPVKQAESVPGKGVMLRVLVPVQGSTFGSEGRILQVLQPVPTQLAEDADEIYKVRGQYKQLLDAREGLKQIYRITLTLTLLLALLSALAMAFVLSDRLSAPLSALAAGTRAVAKGDFTQRQPVYGRDELGVLTQQFNTMTLQLAEAQSTLERNQAQLAASKAYVEAVLGNLTSGVLAFDERMRMRSANQAVSLMLGIDFGRMKSDRLQEWAEEYPTLAGLVDAISEGCREGGDAQWRKQIDYAHQQGQQILLLHGARMALRDDAGFVVVVDDVTGLIHAQREAAWGEVARRLAHEIKNPLTPIQLSAERLEMKLTPKLAPADAEMLSRSAQTIVAQVSALKRMVDAFKEYARVPSGKLKSVDLHALIGEVLALYESSSMVRTELHPGTVLVLGDATQLRQVLHNLVQNAQDALEGVAEPQVVVRTSLEGSMARMVVEDNGAGFEREVLKQAFQPYATTKPKGTGLGLAIVKKIVEEHKGTIAVGNREPHGARVSIDLPLVEETWATS